MFLAAQAYLSGQSEYWDKDTNFAPGVSRLNGIDAYVTLADRSRLIAGRFDSVDNVPAPGVVDLVRLGSGGEVETVLTTVFPEDSWVYRMIEQPGKGILLWGTFPTPDGGYEGIRRLLPDGNWDETFAAITDVFEPPVLDGMGRLLVSRGGLDRRPLRFSADGVPDPTFLVAEEIRGIRFLCPIPSGGMLLFYHPDGSSPRVSRVDDDGTLVADFPSIELPVAHSRVALPDGSVVVVTTHSSQSGRVWRLRRLRPDGQFDFEYATRPDPNSPAAEDVRLSIIGVIHDLLVASSGGDLKRVWFDDLEMSGVPGECSTDGQYVWVYNSYFGNAWEHYTLKAEQPPSYVVQPRVLNVSGRQDLVPLGWRYLIVADAVGLTPFTYEWFRDGDLIGNETSSSLLVEVSSTADEGSYSVAVSNNFGTALSAGVVLTVDTEHAVATITQPLGDQVVDLGDTVTFAVESSAVPAATYDWYHNDVRIEGATSSTLTLTGVGTADLGTYRVRARNVVVNSAGTFSSGRSSTATLRRSQSIEFSGPMGWWRDVGHVTLMAAASSGLPVDFEVVSGPASLTGPNLTLTGSGTVLVRATQVGDETWGEVVAERSFIVNDGYAGWVRSRFLAEELDDPSTVGPEVVLAGDGLTNLMKYALGMEPRLASSAIPEQVSVENGIAVYRFTRPNDRFDLSYVVEASIDLRTWTSETVDLRLESTDNSMETWRADWPVSRGDRIFFRLQVSQLPPAQP
ncbi:immunoglobulin domain-containing protein [Actomonas aquatica]|uniref:Immunoglobulin domain-containing protein n=1 Tax=Actomonas aquatica TaxID=2866162 RepID=A0ABZ1C387_9BACT|nr:immunoglobulin domain-containing protein [Opitutus sp. WL0086]WRQ85906.1 immunoglobulin domain-containing protein [Opitutus sp. WL0086]